MGCRGKTGRTTRRGPRVVKRDPDDVSENRRWRSEREEFSWDGSENLGLIWSDQ